MFGFPVGIDRLDVVDGVFDFLGFGEMLADLSFNLSPYQFRLVQPLLGRGTVFLERFESMFQFLGLGGSLRGLFPVGPGLFQRSLQLGGEIDGPALFTGIEDRKWRVRRLRMAKQ